MIFQCLSIENSISFLTPEFHATSGLILAPFLGPPGRHFYWILRHFGGSWSGVAPKRCQIQLSTALGPLSGIILVSRGTFSELGLRPRKLGLGKSLHISHNIHKLATSIEGTTCTEYRVPRDEERQPTRQL